MKTTNKIPAAPKDTAPDWTRVAELEMDGAWSNDPATNAEELASLACDHPSHPDANTAIACVDALGYHALSTVLRIAHTNGEQITVREALIRAELAKQGMRRANAEAGERGWFVDVRARAGEAAWRVWATDAA